MPYGTRAVEIIEVLMKENDFMTVSQLSEVLKISKRTIFRDMDEVEALLAELGSTLEKRNRSGIRLNLNEDQIKQFNHITKSQVTPVYSQEARLNLLMIELLKSREAQKLFYFADKLKVSEATISNDMDKLEPWFSKRQLILVRKPGYGVYVAGSEKSFRKAIVDYLYETYEHDELVELIHGELIGKKPEESSMIGLIDKDILIKVGALLKAHERLLEKKLADGAYMGLLIHLAIAISRIQRGESIVMNEAILNGLRTDDQFVIAKEIATAIEETFVIKVPEDEVGYITMHLKGSKLRSSAVVEQHDFIVSNFELSRTTAKMIQKFKELSGYDFRDDEKLLIGLATHLRPALTRMKLGLDIRNPLIEKIKEMYPEIFAMTSEVAMMIESQYQVSVPQEEIAFLAMHFGAAIERFRKGQQVDKVTRIGVVCSSGIGTSSLLASRLGKLIPKVEIVGQFSKEDVILGQIKQYQIECLISTIPLEQSEYPCIVVSPLLVENDVERIKQMLGLLNQELRPYHESVENKATFSNDRIKMIQILSTSILNIVEHFKVHELETLENDPAGLMYISTMYSENENHKNSLLAQLEARERLGATVLRNEGVKLMHTKTEAVKKLTFGVIRLKTPVKASVKISTTEWASENIDLLIIMLLPTEVSKYELGLMSHISKSLIEDTGFVTELKTLPQESLRQALSERLNRWFESQLY